jgi:hypothetical protein
VALLHALGTGSDVNTSWMLILTATCILVVLAAICVRAAGSRPDRAGARFGTVVASFAAVLALAVWLPTGPLQSGWAKRAGTPSSLLPASTVGAQR